MYNEVSATEMFDSCYFIHPWLFWVKIMEKHEYIILRCNERKETQKGLLSFMEPSVFITSRILRSVWDECVSKHDPRQIMARLVIQYA